MEKEQWKKNRKFENKTETEIATKFWMVGTFYSKPSFELGLGNEKRLAHYVTNLNVCSQRNEKKVIRKQDKTESNKKQKLPTHE